MKTYIPANETEILKLTDALCAPVGGTGPAVSQAAASFFATYTLQLPSAPTLVAPTPAPNLGNVSDLNNYPPCDVSNSFVIDWCKKYSWLRFWTRLHAPKKPEGQSHLAILVIRTVSVGLCSDRPRRRVWSSIAILKM